MKTITILGSPKRHGHSAGVLSIFEEHMAARGHAIMRIHTIDHAINGCLGCGACQQGQELGGCVQQDEGALILKRLIDADAIVYATPLYGWDYASQIKPLLDRHFALAQGFGSNTHRSALAGKRLALLVTCAGPIENNADLIQLQFERFAGRFLQASSFHTYVVPFCRPLDPARAQETAMRMTDEITDGARR
jgi:multimeric flavodoxin WrbA